MSAIGASGFERVMQDMFECATWLFMAINTASQMTSIVVIIKRRCNL